MSNYMLEVHLQPHGLGVYGEASCGCVVDVQEDTAHVMLCDGHGDEPHDMNEAIRTAGFLEGQNAERALVLPLVKVLDKLLTMLDEGVTFLEIKAGSLGDGAELAHRAAKGYLNASS